MAKKQNTLKVPTAEGTTKAADVVAKPSFWTPEYGGVPNLPAYATDTTTQTTSQTGETLGTDIAAELRKNLPMYNDMLVKDVSNIYANLGGQVAPDVINLLQQQAAERGIATGMPGAGSINAGYLRALGLTSLQLQQLGNQQLTAAMARTPIQQRQTTTQAGTTTGTTKRDLGAERAVYAAAPNPKAAAEQAMANAIAGMKAGQELAGGGGVSIAPSPTRPASALDLLGVGTGAPAGLSPQTLAAQQATFAATDAARQRLGGLAPGISYGGGPSYGTSPALMDYGLNLPGQISYAPPSPMITSLGGGYGGDLGGADAALQSWQSQYGDPLSWGGGGSAASTGGIQDWADYETGYWDDLIGGGSEMPSLNAEYYSFFP